MRTETSPCLSSMLRHTPGTWPLSLKDLRSLEIRPAIVIVVPEGPRPQFDSHGPLPDGYVTNGQTFLRDLPLAVTSAVTRYEDLSQHR